MAKRKANLLGDVSSEDPRVVSGQALVTELRAEHTQLRYHDVRETPADGLCFLHAVMQQIRIDDPSTEWQKPWP